MADRKKKELFEKMDYVLDTVIPGSPKMVSGDGFRAGLDMLSHERFVWCLIMHRRFGADSG